MEIAKLRDEKERSQAEKNVLTALDVMEEVIAGRRQLKLKGDQQSNPITDTSVL